MNAYIDAVAKPLEKVVKLLEAENLKYVVSYTRPKREYNGLDRNSFFVIRQRIDADGVYNLTVAAKLKRGGVKMAYKITEDCVACGSCAAACPVEAIKEGEPHYTITEDCVDCGTCAETCPTGAIVAPE